MNAVRRSGGPVFVRKAGRLLSPLNSGPLQSQGNDAERLFDGRKIAAARYHLVEKPDGPLRVGKIVGWLGLKGHGPSPPCCAAAAVSPTASCSTRGPCQCCAPPGPDNPGRRRSSVRAADPAVDDTEQRDDRGLVRRDRIEIAQGPYSPSSVIICARRLCIVAGERSAADIPASYTTR